MENEFREWLIQRENTGAAKNYPRAIHKISKHYSEQTGTSTDIYATTNQHLISEIARGYSKSGKYRAFGDQYHGLFRNAVGRYSEFFVHHIGHDTLAEARDENINLLESSQDLTNTFAYEKDLQSTLCGQISELFPVSDEITPLLIEAILNEYQLSWSGVHGITHWARVLENGLHLASITGAKTSVVALFAVFHDSKRTNEGRDPGHGRRGAEFGKILNGKAFHLSGDDFTLFETACAYHTDRLTTGDVTVQTCWDADRLDLGRVGIIPDPKHLCTAAAKEPKFLSWAYERSRLRYEPEICKSWTLPDNGVANNSKILMYSVFEDPEWVEIFRNKPYQGQTPEDAEILFVGRDANYPDKLCQHEFFQKVKEYHKDGVTFWKDHNCHHPFLHDEYPFPRNTGGVPYHRAFTKLRLTTEYAELVSFVELREVPTFGVAGKISRNEFRSKLDPRHMIRLDRWMTKSGKKLVFLPKTVKDDISWFRQKHGHEGEHKKTFEFLEKPATDEEFQGLPINYQNREVLILQTCSFASTEIHALSAKMRNAIDRFLTQSR